MMWYTVQAVACFALLTFSTAQGFPEHQVSLELESVSNSMTTGTTFGIALGAGYG